MGYIKADVTACLEGDKYVLYNKDAHVASNILGLPIENDMGDDVCRFTIDRFDECRRGLLDAGYDMQKETQFDTAVKLIQSYYKTEFFDEELDLTEPAKIGLAYTTDEDTELPIEVYADLTDFVVVYKYNDMIVKKEDISDYETMRNFLGNLEFGELTYLTDEEKASIAGKEKDWF